MDEAAAFTNDKKEYLSINCVMGLYIPLLFTKGYNFSNDTEMIKAVKSIDDQRPGKETHILRHANVNICSR